MRIRARLAAVPLLALLAFLLPRPALANDRFDQVKSRAEKIDSLGGFLDKYVGKCAPYEAACLQNLKDTRQQWTGKTIYVTLGDRAASLMKVDTSGSQFRVLFTPFVDGGGYGLTHGAPKKQDSSGNPLIDFIQINGAMPEGMGEMELKSAFRAGQVGVELVFKPEGTWKLKRKGEEGFLEGVKARFLGIRLVANRTGTEIASKLL